MSVPVIAERGGRVMGNTEFLQVALTAARAGIPIVPVGDDGSPLVSCAGASCFVGMLREWARQYPTARAGVVRDGRVAHVLKSGDSDELLKLASASAERTADLQESTTKITFLSDVAPMKVDWLWPGRIPLGMLVILDGNPGLGKSSLALDLAARLTRGERMPDGSPGPHASGAIILTAEDDLARVVRPRLEAAGAVLGRVATIRARTGSIDRELMIMPEDLLRIESAIKRLDAKLLIVDPLVAYLPGDVNVHNDQDVRRALTPLICLAERTGVCVLAIRHLRKAGGGDVLHRGGGSIGIIAAARAGMVLAPDPADSSGLRRILAWTKMSVAKMPGSFAFHLENSTGETAHVSWDGPSDITAQALLASFGARSGAGAIEEAEDFLREILAFGPVVAADIVEEATARGIAKATLRRAKKKLDVRSVKQGGPGQEQRWLWQLAGADEQEPAQSPSPSDPLQPRAIGNSSSEADSAEGDHRSTDGQLRLITFGDGQLQEGDDASLPVERVAPRCPGCGSPVLSWSFGHVCPRCRRLPTCDRYDTRAVGDVPAELPDDVGVGQGGQR